MSNFEWFLLVVVVVAVPLLIAVIVTLWTLEMARQRKRANRPGVAATVGVKRSAVKADGDPTSGAGTTLTSASLSEAVSPSARHDRMEEVPHEGDTVDSPPIADDRSAPTPDSSGSGSGSGSDGGSDSSASGSGGSGGSGRDSTM